MAKLNAILYPYSAESSCIARYSQLTNYNIIMAVVPGYIPDTCKDISYFDKLRKSDIPVNNEFEESMQNCDVIIWAPYNYKDIDDYFNKVVNQMMDAMRMGRDIVCMQTLSKPIKERFELQAKDYGVRFDYYTYHNYNYKLKELSELQQIDTPIVTILGSTENIDKFHTQLFVRDALLSSGYKISQIGSKNYSDFFGISPFPSFMFDNNISDKQKILNFNSFLKDIELSQKPEIIVIGIPGELMKYNDRFNFNFGVMPYLSSCACTSDFTILNIGSEPINREYLTNIENILHYRFGYTLDCLFMSNKRFNQDSLKIDYGDLEIDILPENMFYDIKHEVERFSKVPVFDTNSGYDEVIDYFSSQFS